jgi:hypothetical protein
MRSKTLKKIAVSGENYIALKKLESAGDSFSSDVTEVLKQSLNNGPSRAANSKGQNAATDTTTASHKLYVIPANSDQVKQILKPTVVTICLTDMHEECTGNYVDTTNSFRIQCKCSCHLRRRRKRNLRK